MKLTKRTTNQGFTLVELLVVIAIIAALAAMATPVIMKQNKKAAMTTTTSNAKQIFYLLIEFDGDYGQFPGQNIDDVDLVSLASGSDSNTVLGMFLEGGYIKSEEIFFAKGGASTNKVPDNVINPSGKMLEAGECGFAYYRDASTSDNSGRPVLMAPMPTTAKEFNPDPYDGKAVVLRIDGAVKQLLLKKTTKKAKIGGGKTLFETGDDTVWGTDGYKAADLLLPK